MKPTFGSAYLDDNLPQLTTILYSFHFINRGHCLRTVVINIRASKNIPGLVKVSVTSPARLMKFFLNVEPCLGFYFCLPEQVVSCKSLKYGVNII